MELSGKWGDMIHPHETPILPTFRPILTNFGAFLNLVMYKEMSIFILFLVVILIKAGKC